MTQFHNNTELKKGKHLTQAECAQISILKSEGYSNRQIAARLGSACDFRSYFASVLTVILHSQFRNPAVFVK